MKIDDNFSPSGDLRSQIVNRTTETHMEGPGIAQRPDSPAEDSASLSNLSVELSRAVEQDPPEVVARIQRLQEAVANGTYAVPSQAVAAKIIDSLGGDS
jgi:flagellar biosynthesis anti-sigma factor FlgM